MIAMYSNCLRPRYQRGLNFLFIDTPNRTFLIENLRQEARKVFVNFSVETAWLNRTKQIIGFVMVSERTSYLLRGAWLMLVRLFCSSL